MLSTAEKQQLLKALQEQKRELAESLKQIQQSTQPVELDQQAVGRVSRVDAIQQQQMQKAAQQRMQQRLQLVEQALQDVNSEDFGLCSQCEEHIPFKRLLVRPEAKLCINCAGRAS